MNNIRRSLARGRTFSENAERTIVPRYSLLKLKQLCALAPSRPFLASSSAVSLASAVRIRAGVFMSLSRGSRNGWDRGGSTLLLDYGSSMILSYFRTKVLSYHTILPETMYGSTEVTTCNTFESIYFRKYSK